MDLEAVGSSPIGSLVPIWGTDPLTKQHYDYFAFLPSPLPRAPVLSSRTWTCVAAAEAALGRLDQAARHAQIDPALLRKPALRREAQSTSALEGTFAPFETVLASETEDRHGLPAEVREVLNYVVAAEEGFAWVQERPITVGLLEKLQGILVANTPSEHRDAGAIRTQQVVVGNRRVPVEESRYVPPPPGDQLRAAVETWIAWQMDDEVQLSPVARAALAHYQFEALHPFSDGNGRIGRLLIAMQLLLEDVLSEAILVVSPWFEARRQSYQDGLLELTKTGDWDAWVTFFAEGVEASANSTRTQVDALLNWRDDALEVVRKARISGVAERVAGELIGDPVLRASSVAKIHGITPVAAMNALRRLADAGLLREHKFDNGRVQFIATEVIRLLN